MLDQVGPEGGTPGMLWLASELAGAEEMTVPLTLAMAGG